MKRSGRDRVGAVSEPSIDFQRQRYDREAVAYDRHHGDPYSQLYRDEFIRDKIFRFDLSGKKVLDAMSASGIETGYLISRGAVVTGLDISAENAGLYEEKWGCPCLVHSIHQTGIDDASFDVVYIYGGLHHVLPILDETMTEIHRILKPGGYFCFVEPNADTWMNALRSFWYRRDKRFHESEEGISYRRVLRPYLDLGFVEGDIFFGGTIAYLVIAQSLIIRTPRLLKKILWRPLFLLEKITSCLPFSPNLFFAAVWRKTGS